MIVLALDASTTAIGWALFDFSKRHPDDLLGRGLERLNGSLWWRLKYGSEKICHMINSRPPIQIAVIETPVVYKNAASSIKQAYMVGVLGTYAYYYGLEVMEVRPDERLTALGLPHKLRNPKPQVVRNVNQIYGLALDEKREHDIADAIAIGWAARRALIQEGRLDG